MRTGAKFLVISVALIGPALSATPFDGVYHGNWTWNGNSNSRCPLSGEMNLRVTDGKFMFGSPEAGGERITATVGADGSFSAQSGQRYVQGKIQGDQLNATLSGARCNYTWTLKK